MISENLVLTQLGKHAKGVPIQDLAMSLKTSVAQVRHKLKNLGDLVEYNDRDEWRVVKENIEKNTLSESERRERDSLEKTIQQAFEVAGKSLKVLRDKRLYRETHPTFESYIRDRFNFTRRNAYYLIEAAEVVENLKCEQIVHKNSSIKILPNKESQCRPLARLSPKKQLQVWEKAVEKAGGNIPSARLIQEIVSQNQINDKIQSPGKTKELIYQPGNGIDYIVHLDRETFELLTMYQDKIGTATKNGAIGRLLKNAISD